MVRPKWINRADLFDDFADIIGAVSDDQLRGQLNHYFASQLPRRRGRKAKEPSRDEIHMAVLATIREFPQVVDYYIREKERDGDNAVTISDGRVAEIEKAFIGRLAGMIRTLQAETDFYATRGDTLDEARARVLYLKDQIEHKDGHRVFYGLDGKPLRREEVIQLMFRLTWHATPSDVNR